MVAMESYIESAPLPQLAAAVRTVWIQRSGAVPYLQRHIPAGGVEIHVRIGGGAQLLGPLTGPWLELIPPHTTIVGVRFRAGHPPQLPVPLNDLVDQRVALTDLWGSRADRLAEEAAQSLTSEQALLRVQAHLERRLPEGRCRDPLMARAVDMLMPWPLHDVAAVATQLSLSASQLRRRCRQTTGVSPKFLQRSLRLQGFLALAQADSLEQRRAGGMAALAADAGYADQAHLSRECIQLTGLTPRQLVGGPADRCACGHEHGASYRPFLARRRAGAGRLMLDSFKTGYLAEP